MMRKSLFERIKEDKIAYFDEIVKIHNLIQHDYYLEEYIPQEFHYTNYRFKFCNYNEALKYILNLDLQRECATFHNEEYCNKKKIGINSFLDCLEFFRTLCLNKIGELQHTECLKQLIEILEFDSSKIGYSLIYDKTAKVYKARLKNPEAEAVALTVKETTRNKIYNYLTLRNGKVADKRECIKSLADDVELICKKYSNIAEYDKLKQFIQCTRHTKDEPKKEFPFYYKNEEKWLDKTFEMIIGILSFTKTKEIVKEIKELENKEGE